MTQTIDQSDSQLATAQRGAIAQFNEQNPVGALLQAIVEKGIDAQQVVAVEKLTALYIQLEERNAAAAYAQDMALLQSELPKVLANRAIPAKDGSIRSRFADYEQLDDAIDPYLRKYGFITAFGQRAEGNRIYAILKITHKGGHSSVTEFGARATSGPPGCSDAQIDGAAFSLAKRYALCAALNVVVTFEDARVEGGYITQEQADKLKARVKATGSDEGRFLKFAAADSFEHIRTTKYTVLDQFLAKKEHVAVKPQPTAQNAPASTATQATPAVSDWNGFIRAAQEAALDVDGDLSPEVFDRGINLALMLVNKKGKGPSTSGDWRERMLSAIKGGLLDWKTGKIA